MLVCVGFILQHEQERGSLRGHAFEERHVNEEDLNIYLNFLLSREDTHARNSMRAQARNGMRDAKCTAEFSLLTTTSMPDFKNT